MGILEATTKRFHWQDDDGFARSVQAKSDAREAYFRLMRELLELMQLHGFPEPVDVGRAFGEDVTTVRAWWSAHNDRAFQALRQLIHETCGHVTVGIEYGRKTARGTVGEMVFEVRMV